MLTNLTLFGTFDCNKNSVKESGGLSREGGFLDWEGEVDDQGKDS